MDKREKLEFILYQIKIMIKKLDYTRIFIISKKIEPKNIEDKTIADLKVTYYSFLVFYYRHEGKYSEVANSYGSILETLHNVY
jgi:26S proteasome regulatory subunit N5